MKIFEKNRPIEQQLRKHVEDLILAGSLAVDQSIPSAREIAMNYKVNTVTVNETVRDLIRDGILELKRGAGICVSPGAVQNIQTRRSIVELETVARPKTKAAGLLSNPRKHLSWC